MTGFAEALQGLSTVSILVRILLAALVGGLIGFERETKRSPAGLRTFALVCIGAALLIMLNMYLYELYPASKTDVGRIAASVVSGMGFLGAGTILITRNQQVRGLTTAAELWATAAIGLALGAGFYLAALVSTLAILCFVVLMQPIDSYLMEYSRNLIVYLELPETESPYRLFQRPETAGITVSSCLRQQIPPVSQGDATYIVTLVLDGRRRHSAVLEQLQKVEDVHYICEVPK